MKKFFFALATGLMLLLPMAPKADAQVVVRVGPRYHHRYYHHYYHHTYYRHHYYRHHYYR